MFGIRSKHKATPESLERTPKKAKIPSSAEKARGKKTPRSRAKGRQGGEERKEGKEEETPIKVVGPSSARLPSKARQKALKMRIEGDVAEIVTIVEGKTKGRALTLAVTELSKPSGITKMCTKINAIVDGSKLEYTMTLPVILSMVCGRLYNDVSAWKHWIEAVWPTLTKEQRNMVWRDYEGRDKEAGDELRVTPETREEPLQGPSSSSSSSSSSAESQKGQEPRTAPPSAPTAVAVATGPVAPTVPPPATPILQWATDSFSDDAHGRTSRVGDGETGGKTGRGEPGGRDIGTSRYVNTVIVYGIAHACHAERGHYICDAGDRHLPDARDSGGKAGGAKPRIPVTRRGDGA
jgi:hypothetical protein